MIFAPQFGYCGLTIVTAHPSRFDNETLLSGRAGSLVDAALSPVCNRLQCYIMTAEEFNRRTLPQGTKVVLLLGEYAHKKFFTETSLMEQRGAPAVDSETNVVYVSSIFPQDAEDRWDIEGKQNIHRIIIDRENENDEDAGEIDEKSTHGRTKRKNYKFWLRRDLKKTAAIVKEGLKVHTAELNIYPSPEEVIEELSTTKNQRLYFDLENDENLNVTCLGYAFGKTRAICVPMFQTHYTPKRYFYDPLTTCKILRAFAVAFRDNEVVVHNAAWDLFLMFWKYRINLPKKIFCTMVAWNRLYPEVEKSLGHVLSFLTHQPYHKNEGAFAPFNTKQAESLYYYNAKDVASLPLIYEEIIFEAARLGAAESIAQANASIRPYLIMQLHGMRVDRGAQQSIRESANRRTLQMERILKLLVGFELNPRSPKQVAAYLYDKRKIADRPPKDLTASKTLLQLYLKTNLEVIPYILEARGQSMRRSKVTFVDFPGAKFFFLNKKDNRYTCRYNIAGTNTFRLSAAKLLKLYGNNAQNWEKDLRQVIIPDEGKIFGVIDQAGAEALIVAYLCRMGNFRQLFLSGIKAHVYVAMHLFREEWEKLMKCDLSEYINCPIPKLTSLPRWKELEKHIKESDNWVSSRRYYHHAKMTCHSANYNIKAPTFRLNILDKSDGKINISLSQAQHYLTTYHKLFPEIQQWHVDVITEVRRTRTLRNLFGFPRVFTGPDGDDLFKEAFAFVPQSTVGTITNLCITECQEHCESNQLFKEAAVDILANTHDGCLYQCKTGFEIPVGKVFETHMNRKLVSPRGETFFMKSETKFGTSWKI